MLGVDRPGKLITTPPLVVMVTNTCAPDLKKKGFQCNQNAAEPRDKFGSVTVLDLCHDTGAADAFWGHDFGGGMGGLAVADITPVDCGLYWKGKVSKISQWLPFIMKPDAKGVKR